MKGAFGRTIYVDGVLNISVPEGDDLGTDIVIDVPIIVRDGGVLNVHTIRDGKKVVFKKRVIVQSGGEWKFTRKADVELYYENHEAHGKFIVDGDNEQRVKITSRRNGGSYSKSAYIVGRGSTDHEKSLVYIEYADITNVYTDLDRIRVDNPRIIYESTFQTTRTAETQGLFLFKITRPLAYFTTWGSINRRKARVEIKNSVFEDVTTGVQPMQSIQYGIYASDASSVHLDNVEVDRFKTGFFAINNDQVVVRNSDVTNNAMGVCAESGSTIICNTDFLENEFASVHYGTGSGIYYDNNFAGMRGGAVIQNSGIHRFRNNDFVAYCYGVESWGTMIYMRNEVRPGLNDDLEFGRNDFNGTVANYTFGGCATTDIGLARGADLIVDCGYNMFSAYSGHHVTSDAGTGSINASYNQWNPGATPRFAGIGWTGNHLDEQEDPDDNCGMTINEAGCPNGMPPRAGEDYSELGFDNMPIYTYASTVRTDVLNSSLSGSVRRNKAWEYFELVSKIDSGTYQIQLKNDMQEIASNSSLDSNLRSAAMFIKACIHVARLEYDSAQSVLSSVMSTFPMKSDSVPANWMSLYINAITDTTMHVDSLIGVHTDRILADLRRKTTYGSSGLSKINPFPDPTQRPSVSGLVVTLDGPSHPNPSSTGTVELMVTSSGQTKCLIDIADSQGVIVQSKKHPLTVGANRVMINTNGLTPGAYTARVRCDDTVNLVSFVVTR